MSSLTLLPLTPIELEESLIDLIKDVENETFTAQEITIKIEEDFNLWLENSATNIPEEIKTLLENSTWFKELEKPREKTAGKLYEHIVNKLVKQCHIGRRTAVISLSYLPIIIRLAKDFHLSSAGIADVLNESDQRVLLHWKGIDKILTALKLNSKLQEHLIDDLLLRDRENMENVFKDADINSIIEIITYDAKLFELDDEFTTSLKENFSPTKTAVFIPYLQSLYYLCIIAQFHDHPLEYLYTFKPRGKEADKIFKVFPAELTSSGNPILNNFKAIDRLSIDWARSREDHPIQAKAFVKIILGLSSLSFSSRRYLAGKIRGGLLRYIELECPKKIVIPKAKSIDDVCLFIDKVSKSETNSRGIIEQRVCDFMCVVNYCGDDWRSRGLGDPVNATNTASRKLGDADFQDILKHTCIAVEAHGGNLTPIYLREHLRTLKHNLDSRIQEWQNISDLKKWSIKVVFVAHKSSCTPPLSEIVAPVQIEVEVTNYYDFWSSTKKSTQMSDSQIIKHFNTWVIEKLASNNTPYYVKNRTLDLLNTE